MDYDSHFISLFQAKTMAEKALVMELACTLRDGKWPQINRCTKIQLTESPSIEISYCGRVARCIFQNIGWTLNRGWKAKLCRMWRELSGGKVCEKSGYSPVYPDIPITTERLDLVPYGISNRELAACAYFAYDAGHDVLFIRYPRLSYHQVELPQEVQERLDAILAEANQPV
jgi:hypothetical protein